MAQGYLEPLDGRENIEDVGEEYFQILLQRCFFQDIAKDEHGEVVSCKIHDLMHDVAQEVAGKQICIANSTTSSIDKKTQHIYFEDVSYPDILESYISATKIRTYLHYFGLNITKNPQFDYSRIPSKLRNLRALELSHIGTTILSHPIGELLHLRYLKLSHNFFEMLPDSIMKLVNLQTLDLGGCFNLTQLPKDLSRLIRLRAIDIEDVPLSCMPSGMEKLTNLCRLNLFVVAEISELASLGDLRNLKGHLAVKILPNYRHVQRNPFQEGYLSNKEHLSNIVIEFELWGREYHDNVEDLMGDLQPHSNLKVLEIYYYCGVRIPRWANLTVSLPNLVKVVIFLCQRLKELLLLSKLRFLKTLRLNRLLKLEYIENTTSYGEAAEALTPVFFPSLEELELHYLPELKGWWGGSYISIHGPEWGGHRLPSFPRLSKLNISSCPSLTFMPLCPTVETLRLGEFNERLQIMMKSTEDQKEVEGSQHFGDSSSHDPKLKSIIISKNVSYLNSLPMWAFRSLRKMKLHLDDKVESLSDIGNVLQSCSSSLQSLTISNCENLRSLSGGLEYLTSLESLYLYKISKLSYSEEEENYGMPWRCLHQCLRSLKLSEKTNLARGMCYLTSLQSLKIDRISKLETLPDWIGCLSSLQELEINLCPLQFLPEAMRKLTSLQRLQINSSFTKLEIRCQGPNGEDWSKIQHIPHIRIDNFFY